jgi:TM2 domain-containing membrane protein YozV
MQVEGKGQLANAALARFYLCIGGIFGAHRLYLGQFFESLVYLSTFGVFLLGPVYDVFFLNRMVQNHNDLQIKSDLSEEDGDQR